MRSIALLLSLIALVSCNRDPNVAKVRYLENGNKYFDRGKYKEASIMYRQSLQKDQKYGPAHYRLAQAYLKLNQVPPAVGSLRRALELLPEGTPDHTDSAIKLAELYLAFGQQNKQVVQEAAALVEGLLKRDANSFDGHRLQADLHLVGARQELQAGNGEAARKLVDQAIAEYRKADSIKPNQAPVIAALGRGHASKNQLPEAEAAYKRAIELQKTNPQPYFELYGVYLLQKRLPEAEAVLRTGFANNPKQYRFLMDLAFHYYAQNRREEMVKVLDELKSRHQDYKQAYITAGDFYLRLRDPEGAIAQYQQGMEADEEQKSTYQKRIIEVLMRQGKRAEAARLNEEILKAKPDDPDARGLQASLMLERGDVQKAMDDLQQVVRSAPENFVARFNLGRAHMAKGEVEQARQQFEQAVRLRPDYIPPQLALAHLHITRREFDMALRTTAQILARDRNNMGALLLQSAALMGQGKFQDSRDLLQQMLNASPNSADVWFQLGMVNLVEKRFREAEAGFQKAYDLSPSNPRGLLGVVETYLAQGRVDAGIQKLQAEAQKHPERSDFHLMLGNTAVRTGRLDLAIENFNRLVAKVDPKSRVAADAYLRLGESYRRKGDLASGIAALNKASEIVPNDAVIVGTLALTLDGAGRRDEAKRAYEDVIKLNPNHAIALNNLAFLMAETGDDLNQALTYAQRAKQRLPQIDEVSDTLGWIYLKKNLSEDAVLIFQDLVKKAPKHPTYRYHLGMALSQKGDKTNAIRELQEALKNKPQREEEVKIKELLERLG